MPPKPKALTPATLRSGAPPQSSDSARVRKRVSASRSWGSSQCSVGGSTPWCSARAVLISAAAPAAGMVWPIIDFTEPSTPLPEPPGRPPAPAAPAGPKNWANVSSSAASPTGVAVPWASISPTVAGSRPDADQARSSASSWPATLGFITLDARPSLATPVPRMTAYTRSPSRSASARRFSTTMPVPSPISRPSADRSKGRMASLGLSARSWEKTVQKATSWQWCTPPATTASQRPERSSATAWSTATSELAQAASTV